MRFACAGVHPFTAPLGVLNEGERYERIAASTATSRGRSSSSRCRSTSRCRPADRALAVYNALRGELPLVAALAANAPLHAGRDTGLASVRPHIGGLLPRQGVPPILPSWEAYADALSSLADPGAVVVGGAPAPALRDARDPRARRAADGRGGGRGRSPSSTRWSRGWPSATTRARRCPRARGGRSRRTAGWRRATAPPARCATGSHALLDALEPVAERLGCADELARARALASDPAAERIRAALRDRGARGAVAALADAFERA